MDAGLLTWLLWISPIILLPVMFWVGRKFYEYEQEYREKVLEERIPGVYYSKVNKKKKTASKKAATRR